MERQGQNLGANVYSGFQIDRGGKESVATTQALIFLPSGGREGLCSPALDPGFCGSFDQ